jgi:hypothetical protein
MNIKTYFEQDKFNAIVKEISDKFPVNCYFDCDNPEERKFVKLQLSGAKTLIKRIKRVPIDATASFRCELDNQAQEMIDVLERASRPLLDALEEWERPRREARQAKAEAKKVADALAQAKLAELEQLKHDNEIREKVLLEIQQIQQPVELPDVDICSIVERDLMNAGLNKTDANLVVAAIKDGKIRHCSIE